MTKINPRVHKVADLIQKEVSEIIRDEVKDPDLHSLFITVISVDVNHDLSQARVYVSEITQKHKQMIYSLNKAAGFIRKSLAPRLKLRHIPTISFVFDDSMENGRKISELLKNN